MNTIIRQYQEQVLGRQFLRQDKQEVMQLKKEILSFINAVEDKKQRSIVRKQMKEDLASLRLCIKMLTQQIKEMNANITQLKKIINMFINDSKLVIVNLVYQMKQTASRNEKKQIKEQIKSVEQQIQYVSSILRPVIKRSSNKVVIVKSVQQQIVESVEQIAVQPVQESIEVPIQQVVESTTVETVEQIQVEKPKKVKKVPIKIVEQQLKESNIRIFGSHSAKTMRALATRIQPSFEIDQFTYTQEQKQEQPITKEVVQHQHYCFVCECQIKLICKKNIKCDNCKYPLVCPNIAEDELTNLIHLVQTNDRNSKKDKFVLNATKYLQTITNKNIELVNIQPVYGEIQKVCYVNNNEIVNQQITESVYEQIKQEVSMECEQYPVIQSAFEQIQKEYIVEQEQSDFDEQPEQSDFEDYFSDESYDDYLERERLEQQEYIQYRESLPETERCQEYIKENKLFQNWMFELKYKKTIEQENIKNEEQKKLKREQFEQTTLYKEMQQAQQKKKDKQIKQNEKKVDLITDLLLDKIVKNLYRDTIDQTVEELIKKQNEPKKYECSTNMLNLKNRCQQLFNKYKTMNSDYLNNLPVVYKKEQIENSDIESNQESEYNDQESEYSDQEECIQVNQQSYVSSVMKLLNLQ